MPSSQSLLKLLARGRDDALTRFAIATALLDEGAANEAVTHLRAALEHDPDYSAAWKMLGKALTEAGDLPGRVHAVLFGDGGQSLGGGGTEAGKQPRTLGSEAGDLSHRRGRGEGDAQAQQGPDGVRLHVPIHLHAGGGHYSPIYPARSRISKSHSAARRGRAYLRG